MTEKQKLSRSAKWILFTVILLVISQAFFLWFMIKHIDELTSSPFVYGARKTFEENGFDISCTCTVPDRVGFSFNKDGIEYEEPKRIAPDYPEINESIFEDWVPDG